MDIIKFCVLLVLTAVALVFSNLFLADLGNSEVLPLYSQEMANNLETSLDDILSFIKLTFTFLHKTCVCLLRIHYSCLWLNVDLDIREYCGFEYIRVIWKNDTP